ncbi:MAG: ABC transporter permease, partial [Treponema sp.]|nr:ABC transporter permease [Treponema sp.]
MPGGAWYPGVACRPGGSGNLLLAVPAEPGAPRLDVTSIEQFCKDTFLLTYEVPEAARLSLAQAEYPVTLIGTNSAYPHVMGFPLAAGAFFSRAAWEGKRRLAVFNEQAAFTLFGSTAIAGNRFRLRGETWLVSGVIRDGDDENCRVYVPSSARGREVLALAALLNPSGGITEAAAKSRLKALGVREGNFAFYHLGDQERLLWERVLAAAGIAAVLALARII